MRRKGPCAGWVNNITEPFAAADGGRCPAFSGFQVRGAAAAAELGRSATGVTVDRAGVYKLILDALYERDMQYADCFVNNRAAELLECSGESALPVIEGVVREEVVDLCPWEETARWSLFPGLTSVLRAYFWTASRAGQVEQACAFLASLYGGTRLEAIDVLHRLIYSESKVPETMMSTIREVARSGTAREREAAKTFIRRYR